MVLGGHWYLLWALPKVLDRLYPFGSISNGNLCFTLSLVKRNIGQLQIAVGLKKYLTSPVN